MEKREGTRAVGSMKERGHLPPIVQIPRFAKTSFSPN